MDIEMQAEDTSGEFPIWDLKTSGSIVPIITDEKEEIQTATLACFLEKGSIKQIQDVGVNWASFLTGDTTFGELDAEIRQSLINADKTEYVPNYLLNDDKLTLQVQKRIY